MKKFFLTFFLVVIVAAVATFIYLSTSSNVKVDISNSQTASTTPSPSFTTGRDVPAGMVEYARQNYHFSILYPSTLTLQEQGGDNGTALFLVFQDSQVEHRGFQIFAQPYSGQTITQARFNEDEPSGVDKDQQNISVAGAQGIMFVSSDPVIGDIREIWFIKNGILYEVTTALQFDAWIQSIMNTWQFI